MSDEQKIDEIGTKIDELKQRLETRSDEPDRVEGLPIGIRLIQDFSRSGAFFILIGMLLLAAAYYMQSDSHSSLTFVFVVLGAAVLLYGTGTQAAAKYTGGKTTAGVHPEIWIAGGAGVISLLIALGFIHKASDIKMAFREDIRLAYLDIKPRNWEPDQYSARLVFDGNEAPLMVKPDGSLRAIVTIKNRNREVSYRIFATHIASTTTSAFLGANPKTEELVVDLAQTNFATTANLDLPKINVDPDVSLDPDDRIVETAKLDGLKSKFVEVVPDGKNNTLSVQSDSKENFNFE